MSDNARRHAAKTRAQGQRLEERARQCEQWARNYRANHLTGAAMEHERAAADMRARGARCFADADRLLAVSNAAQRRRRERKEAE